MTNYPGADRSQWFGDRYPGSPIDGNCGVIHTTETDTWPGYGGGSSAPQLTLKPDFRHKRLDVRQHLPLNRSARALQNDAGGVETNTLNCVQIELVGCCDPGIERIWRGWGHKRNEDYIFWPEAPDWALRELGRVLANLHDLLGIKLDGPPNSQWRQTASWGESAAQRFSFRQWRNFYGWCGHQHVPENDHWDPGGLDFGRVLHHAHRFADGDSAPTPSPKDDDMAYLNWPQEDREAFAADVAEAVMTADLNKHDPKGEAFYRGVNVREALKAAVLGSWQSRRKIKRYNAGKG